MEARACSALKARCDGGPTRLPGLQPTGSRERLQGRSAEPPAWAGSVGRWRGWGLAMPG